MLLIFFKYLFNFILIYFCVFVVTFLLSKIYILFKIFKKKPEHTEYKPKKIKEVKKVWNEGLKVWEIED